MLCRSEQKDFCVRIIYRFCLSRRRGCILKYMRVCIITVSLSVTSLDVPFIDFSNQANARPAILVDLGEEFHAFDVGGDIFSLFFSCLFANRISLVDIINAEHFNILGTFFVGSISAELGAKSRGSEAQNCNCEQFHEHCFQIGNMIIFPIQISIKINFWSEYNLLIVQVTEPFIF